MPKGPQGQKRPGDVIGAAIMVAQIATGERENDGAPKAKRNNGLKGAAARSVSLTPEQRSEIARTAASARWKKT